MDNEPQITEAPSAPRPERQPQSTVFRTVLTVFFVVAALVAFGVVWKVVQTNSAEGAHFDRPTYLVQGEPVEGEPDPDTATILNRSDMEEHMPLLLSLLAEASKDGAALVPEEELPWIMHYILDVEPNHPWTIVVFEGCRFEFQD